MKSFRHFDKRPRIVCRAAYLLPDTAHNSGYLAHQVVDLLRERLQNDAANLAEEKLKNAELTRLRAKDLDAFRGFAEASMCTDLVITV